MTKDKKQKEQMVKGFREMQREKIVVYPVGIDSQNRSCAYIVKGDKLWYIRDKKPAVVQLD
jgi:hypothetical protein